MMTLEKFFSEEAARCEKLRVAVQFCYLCRSREIVTLSKEDFVVVSSPSMAVIPSHFFPHGLHLIEKELSMITCSSDPFHQGIEGGSQNRQHVDLSELHIVEQILMIFSKSSEIGKRSVNSLM